MQHKKTNKSQAFNVFSFVFDSDDSVVDILADEMLSHISGAVRRFSPLVSVCLTHPERNAK